VYSNGTVLYTPDANYCGSDSFKYKVKDNDGAESNEAWVNITVSCVNDPPVAVDDTASTSEDTPVLINVTSNDYDIDGSIDLTSVTITQNPSHGSLNVYSNGTVLYTPDANYCGSDSFKYKVKDNDGAESNEAWVNITVSSTNDPPVADFIWAPLIPTTSDNTQFTDQSYDTDGFIVNWTWNFGDGSVAYEQNPVHQYLTPGIYIVTLTVTDNDGLKDSVTKQITVYTPPSLIFSKSDDKDPVRPGELLNYTITIRNVGGLPAYNVSVIEQYDANFIFISSTPAGIGNTWQIGTILPGETKTIKIYGRVAENGEEYIYNFAFYTSSNAGNGFASEQTRVVYPSLGIRKDAPPQVEAGEELVYTITYYNPSEIDLTNVIIKENYPSYTSFKSAYPSPTTGNDTWIISRLAAKSSATITIVLKVASPLANGTILLNNVSISCEGAEAYAEATTLVISSPSLSIDKQDSIDPVTAGDFLNYTILISNSGNDDARNVIVEDEFDELLEIIECNGTINGNKITWIIPIIKANESIVLEIKARVKPIDYEKIIYNNVEARCGESIASDNESTKINPPPIMAYPLLEIEKSANSGEVLQGKEIKYEIIVRNIGDGDAINVTVKDLLGDGLIFIKAEPAASINGSELTWKFDKIPAGEIKVIYVYAKAIKIGSIVNKVNVSSDGLYDEDECVVNVIADTTPPNSRKVFHGYVKNVTFFGSYILHYIPTTTYITLASVDDVGVNHTYYRIWKWNESSGKWMLLFNWKEYKGEKIYLGNYGCGKYEIEFYSIDLAGNIEEIEYNDVVVYS
ncbi:MAG: DUF11 domain-containing protein, partial [Thermoplasmatales archaeon]|nr:DUF11 domain-containing protein [Thermoplasmatales archaeon]